MAKHRHLKHLPHYGGLEQGEHCLMLKFQKPVVNLREALRNRGFIAKCGNLVIRGLLELLEELRRADATLHTLEPRSIFISAMGTKLMAADLFAVCFRGLRVLEPPALWMPYSNQQLREHSLTTCHMQERDMWSVGMIILEILVGTEMVLGLKTNDQVKEVVYYITPWVGQRLSSLLMGLLFEVKWKAVGAALADGVLDSEKKVARAISEVESGMAQHPKLQKIVDEFLEKAALNPAAAMSKWKYDVAEREDAQRAGQK